MAACIVISLLSASPASAEAQRDETAPRATLATQLQDTELHLLAGLSVSFLSAAVAGNFGLPPAVAAVTAVSTAAFAGLAKEIADSMGVGSPELRDLVHTIVGGSIAAVCLGYAYHAVLPEPSGGPEEQALFIGLAVSLSLAPAAHLLRTIR